MRARAVAAVLGGLTAIGCGGAARSAGESTGAVASESAGSVAAESSATSTAAPATAAAIDQGPGNLTITPDGRQIVSLHQYYTPVRVFAELQGAQELLRYPAEGEGALPTGLVSVLGVRSDTAGVLHILDNGNTGKAPPKLVLWDSRANRHVRTIDLKAVTDTNSFINDLAFDYRRNHVYVSDPAGGPNAAIIAVNMATGEARRLLTGHASVVPEQIEFAVEGMVPTRKLPDGTLVKPKIGVDGIGIDYANEWVYYGPLHGRTMYRVRAEDLASAAMGAEQLAGRVERYASKPPSDGIVLDEAGNIYLGDLPNNAYGVIGTNRQYRELARGPELKWVDDFEFAPDGSLYVVTTQLHRSPTLNAGKRAVDGPFKIFRTQPLAPGRQGR
jgi:sugar lactone lactonase YvrE